MSKLQKCAMCGGDAGPNMRQFNGDTVYFGWCHSGCGFSGPVSKYRVEAFRKWDLIQVTLSESQQRAMDRMHPELKKQLTQGKDSE